MTGQNNVDILIAGGGIAGLAAATAAEKQGLTCQILEAQNRLGGRIHSIESNGMWIDLGAQLVNGDMTRVLSLAQQARLYIAPIPAGGALITVDSNGKKQRDYRPEKRNWMQILATAPLEPFYAYSPPPSLAEIIDTLQLDSEQRILAKSLMTELLGQPPEALDGISAIHDLQQFGSQRGEAEFQFRRGFAGIVNHLANHLKHRPQLESVVRQIIEHPDHVEIHTQDQHYRARYVIIAIPPPVARNITFSTPHHAKQLDPLLASFIPGDLIKFILTFDTPFWRYQGLSGYAEFYTPQGLSVVDGSLDDGSLPRLIAFTGGKLAREWAHYDPSSRQHALLSELEKAFGSDVTRHIKNIHEGNWIDHLWCGGAYNSHVRHGGISNAPEYLAAWGKRIVFAGAEIASPYRAYVEGAILSGEQAVERLLTS